MGLELRVGGRESKSGCMMILVLIMQMCSNCAVVGDKIGGWLLVILHR